MARSHPLGYLTPWTMCRTFMVECSDGFQATMSIMYVPRRLQLKEKLILLHQGSAPG